jgi:hypothetical protein
MRNGTIKIINFTRVGHYQLITDRIDDLDWEKLKSSYRKVGVRTGRGLSIYVTFSVENDVLIAEGSVE